MNYTHVRCLSTITEGDITYNLQGRTYEIISMDTVANTVQIECEPFDATLDGTTTDEFELKMDDKRIELFIFDPIDEV
ncbi:hypothetical protein SAMN05421503_1491 [Terribacillus aidingensis]|uniref:Uncharacterized protein n=1 Tax=Terribacillus aidingensis TaxID=586416 RepID=A0A285NQA4_9BACI|nr:hypothetical protein [Terribacillus aidingensis]SNZ10036.1 hypothetical protein SAMN05421503_1491 [Terribacillus aidingensis]